MVHGATVQDRKLARARRAAKNRLQHYGHRIKSAPTESQRLVEAFDFLRAVAAGLGDGEKRALARILAELADERNK